ncbi:unannotated protein [freshwater metagenome]|uniref:Unannotated protein n=1 Tax=freshwater metagenome TaxID=449393 RepID=A0A6J6ZB43_9ZZZZ
MSNPAPSFVKLPVVVAIALPETTVLPAPPTVRFVALPVTPPLKVKVPASELILTPLVPKVITPA